MPAWTDEYLLELQKRGEIELSTDIPVIFDRFSLSIVSGQSNYTLPEGIVSISRITYLGHKVYPYDERTSIAQGLHQEPFTTSTLGRPICYIQHNQGFTQIAFWPTPDSTIGADDTGIWSTDIPNRVIISCWRVATPDGNFRVPEFLRRRLLKYYVNMRAYAKEGPSQNIQAAVYFRERWLSAKNHLRTVMNNVPKAIVKQMEPISFQQPIVPRPTLPIQFGRIVE